jgi:hypothetical protein
VFCDFSCRGYGIPAKKTATGCQSAFGAGNIAGHEMLTGKDGWFHSFSNTFNLLRPDLKGPLQKKWRIPGR